MQLRAEVVNGGAIAVTTTAAGTTAGLVTMTTVVMVDSHFLVWQLME